LAPALPNSQENNERNLLSWKSATENAYNAVATCTIRQFTPPGITLPGRNTLIPLAEQTQASSQNGESFVSLSAIAVIAVAVSMDALAVAIAIGLTLKNVTRRHLFRLGFHFGLFQALMPILGWSFGRTLSGYIQTWDHWLALALLAFIGLRMIKEAIWPSPEAFDVENDPTRGWNLVMLSIATSIDAMAVGLSFAFLRVSVWQPAVLIGLCTGSITAAGMFFGSKLAGRFGRYAQFLGGVMLIGIGLRIVYQHQWG
jgi:manganese efflux pump family protein